MKATQRISFLFWSCFSDPPIVISAPHFYQGNESLLQTVNGLHPEKSAHETYLDVEPVSQILNVLILENWTLFAGDKTSRSLPPKCNHKACMDCLAGQNGLNYLAVRWPIFGPIWPFFRFKQTIHACFAFAFRTQAPTRFVTGEFSTPTREEHCGIV